MESKEKAFCDAVLERLDGDIPILAAVKDKEIPFLNQVRNHPNCKCFFITEENRDKLVDEVLEFMKNQIEKLIFRKWIKIWQRQAGFLSIFDLQEIAFS